MRRESLLKSLPVALGLAVGTCLSLVIGEYGPRVFEGSTSDKLTGLGYQITPGKDRDNILEVRTERFSGWAGRFLAPLALGLAKDRIVRACAEDVYAPFISIRQLDMNGGIIEIYQPFQTDNKASCFPQ